MKRPKFYSYIFCSIMLLSISETVVPYSNLEEMFVARGQVATIISIVAAGIMSAATYQYCSTLPWKKDLLVIEKEYPYVQAWYNSLIIKYPSARFDIKQLLRGNYSGQEHEGWKSSFNQIYCPSAILRNINKYYDKKINGQVLTDEELLFLDVQEFMILCQAGVIEQNQMIQRYLYVFGIFVGLEVVKILYKECTDDDVKIHYLSQKPCNVDSNDWDYAVHYKMMERSLKIVACECAAIFTLPLAFPLFQKPQEYEFSCRHADLDVLQQLLLFFEAFVNKKEDYSKEIKTSYMTYFSSNVLQWYYDICCDPKESEPSIRASIIQDEIQRRILENNKYDKNIVDLINKVEDQVKMVRETGDEFRNYDSTLSIPENIALELEMARQDAVQNMSLEEYEIIDTVTQDILINKKDTLRNIPKSLTMKGSMRSPSVSLSGCLDIANIVALQQANFSNKGLIEYSLSKKISFIQGDFIITSSIFYGTMHIENASMVSYEGCFLEQVCIHSKDMIIDLRDTVVTGDIIFDHPGTVVVDKKTILGGTVSNAQVMMAKD